MVCDDTRTAAPIDGASSGIRFNGADGALEEDAIDQWSPLRRWASGQAAVSLATLGVVCTAVALALFFALIREVGPQRALVITFVNPAVAVLLGVWLLGEPVTPGDVLGAAIIAAGLALLDGRWLPARRGKPA